MSFFPSNYTRNQNSVRRWDNILNNLRKEIAYLRRLTLKGKRGLLYANDKGLVVEEGTPTPTDDGITGFLAMSRAFLNFDLYYNYSPSEEILNPESWLSSFDVDATALTDGHFFTVPAEVGDKSLLNSKVYLQISLRNTYEYTYDNDQATMTIEIIKNNSTPVASSRYGEQYLDYTVAWRTFVTEIDDVFECEVGDTFDIAFSNNGESKIRIVNGSNYTSIIFSILRIVPELSM